MRRKTWCLQGSDFRHQFIPTLRTPWSRGSSIYAAGIWHWVAPSLLQKHKVLIAKWALRTSLHQKGGLHTSRHAVGLPWRVFVVERRTSTPSCVSSGCPESSVNFWHCIHWTMCLMLARLLEWRGARRESLSWYAQAQLAQDGAICLWSTKQVSHTALRASGHILWPIKPIQKLGWRPKSSESGLHAWEKFTSQGRKTLVFVDNSNAYCEAQGLKASCLAFLPKNTTSILHLMDLGTTKSLETLYRRPCTSWNRSFCA